MALDLSGCRNAGERLYMLRQQRFIGVRELGRMAGITGSQVSRIEAGHTLDPNGRTKRALAAALEVSPELIWPLENVSAGPNGKEH